MQWWRHECEGGGVNALEGGWGGGNTVKTVKFENGGGCMTPLASMVVPPLGHAPPLFLSKFSVFRI